MIAKGLRPLAGRPLFTSLALLASTALASTLARADDDAVHFRPGHLLVATRASLISAGTERMVVDFARKSLAVASQ